MSTYSSLNTYKTQQLTIQIIGMSGKIKLFRTTQNRLQVGLKITLFPLQMILNGKSKKEVVEELNKMNIATPSTYKVDEKIYKYNYKETSKKWTTKNQMTF